MKKYWNDIPRVFRVSLIVSFCLVLCVSIISGFVAGTAFATETAITGGFSVALLCVYVVWIAGVMASAKKRMETEPDDVVATSVSNKLQAASLLKLFVLSAVLVLLVVVFHFNVVAALVGVSGMYLPIAVVPLFVKPELDLQQAEKTEKAKSLGDSEVKEQ